MVFAIAGHDVVSFGFGSLLCRISGRDVIYLAFEYILYISFSIGICCGGRNSEAPAIANTCSLHAIIFDIPFMKDDHSQHDAEAKQRILDNIEKYDCHLSLLESDNYLPGFIYSIGLFKKFGHPEVICFGLKTDVMASILNHACDLVKKGETLTTNRLYSGFLEGYKIQFLQVDKEYYQNYVGYACWFYNRTFDFPLLQLVWPDKQHNFPWDTDFNPDWIYKQPLLDRNTDFKFYEGRNLGVFTTKQAFNGDPILYVYHNEEGNWQFHTSLEPNLNDSMVVALEKITKLDPTINEIYYLQFGWRAWRNSKDDVWQCEEYPDDE